MTTSPLDDAWVRLEELFHAALEQPLASRGAFAREACGGDRDLERQLGKLIDAHEWRGETLGFALREVRKDAGPWEPLPRGTRVGAFRVERLIAAGGMGAVYEAQQERPSRNVALKVQQAHLEGGPIRRRFEYEAQILARLRHPSIAHVYDSGVLVEGSRSLPWLTMELVEGGRSITEYANSEGLSRTARIRLLIEVCAAVHYGHGRGVIHRDLKPTNLLVDRGGALKVIDFGIAKVSRALDLPLVDTAPGQLLGTLAYMSPEQAAVDARDLDTRTDVYSLGVVLHELLTGELPRELGDSSLLAAARILAEREPNPEPMNRAHLHPDLRAVVEKALRVDVAQRYTSAAALADDLGRFLSREPVEARPPSAAYQLHRFACRHKGIVALAAALVLALATALVGTSVGLVRARAARAEAQWGRDFLTATLGRANLEDGDGLRVGLGVAMRAVASELEASHPPRMFEAGMRATLGELFLRAGAAQDSERELRRALELAGPGDDAKVAELTDQLANALLGQGRFDEAEEAAAQSRAMWESLNGELSREELAARETQARILRGRGAVESSIVEFRRLLRLREAHLGSEDEATYGTRGLLASALFELEEYPEARQLFAQVHAWRERNRGRSHPRTASAASNLAACEFFLGETEAARALYEGALPELETLGREHPTRLRVLSKYAIVLRHAGRVDESEAMQREAADGLRRTLGLDDPTTCRSIMSLATLLLARADQILSKHHAEGPEVEDVNQRAEESAKQRAYLVEAEECLSGLFDAWCEGERPAGRAATEIIGTLGGVLLTAERFDEAVRVLDQLDVAMPEHVATSPRMQTLRVSQAVALERTGRYEHAFEVISEAVRILEEAGERSLLEHVQPVRTRIEQALFTK